LARMHFESDAGTLGAPYGYFGLWYPAGPELPQAATTTVDTIASRGTADARDATPQLYSYGDNRRVTTPSGAQHSVQTNSSIPSDPPLAGPGRLGNHASSSAVRSHSLAAEDARALPLPDNTGSRVGCARTRASTKAGLVSRIAFVSEFARSASRPARSGCRHSGRAFGAGENTNAIVRAVRTRCSPLADGASLGAAAADCSLRRRCGHARLLTHVAR
jgi:hypothetical protein